MAIDTINQHFVVNILDAAKHLKDFELDILQGLIKKVEILSKEKDEYMVIPKKQCPTLFSSLTELVNKSGGEKR